MFLVILGYYEVLNTEDGKHEVSFCGYFKVNNAVYTCLVIISNPKNGYPSGGVMTGNVVKEIVNYLDR